jgi:hypothetical protein
LSIVFPFFKLWGNFDAPLEMEEIPFFLNLYFYFTVQCCISIFTESQIPKYEKKFNGPYSKLFPHIGIISKLFLHKQSAFGNS